MSNVCHLLSVLVLSRLLAMTSGPSQQQQHHHQLPFVASVLHIVTPASLFLSAPYAEAMFSLLNFSGMLLYAQARVWAAAARPPSLREDACKLGAGLLFGAATLVRSNGLLSGLILLYDVARFSPTVLSMRLRMHDVRRIVVSCASGALIAVAFVVPQIVAYSEFCTDEEEKQRQSWCEKRIPSIYSWVQSHYWYVVPPLHSPHCNTTIQSF